MGQANPNPQCREHTLLSRISMSHCGSSICREPSKMRWPRAVDAAYDERRRRSVEAVAAAAAAAAAVSVRPGERDRVGSAEWCVDALSRPQ